jgi:hypothetical protein
VADIVRRARELLDRRGELRQVAARGAGLSDQAFRLLRDRIGGSGGIFGFAANEFASPVHRADHGAEIGLKKIDGLADAADLDRLVRCEGSLRWLRLVGRRLVSAFAALCGEPLHSEPKIRVLRNLGQVW